MASSNLGILDAKRSAQQVVHFAIGLFPKIESFNQIHGTDFNLTIGINIGECVGGVIGRTKVGS
jgi:class 3 adenylate cyclase